MKRHSFLGDGKKVDIRPTPRPNLLIGRGELIPRPVQPPTHNKKTLTSSKVKSVTIMTLTLLILVFVPTFLGDIIHPYIVDDVIRWLMGLLLLLLIICGVGLLGLIFTSSVIVYENLVDYFNERK